MLGLETALPVVLSTLVNPGMVSLKDVARFMSTTPAAVGRLEGYSSPFALGEPAHITLVDPSTEASEPRGSLSHNNPYQGRDLEGRVVHTMYQGILTVTNGELVERPEVNA